MADAAAAVQGEPERAGDGIHLYPAQHQRHAAGVRARQGEGRTVQGHHQGQVRSAVVRGRIHRADPTARPTGRQPHVQAAAAVEAVLHVRRHAGRRQVRHRRRQPGHGDRRPRTGSGRQRQPQLGQRPHRVYAWVRCRGRIRQQGGGGRAAAVLRIQHPHPGQAHRIAEVRAAHLLLPERPRILDCRGSEGHGFVGVRLSDRIAGRDQYV